MCIQVSSNIIDLIGSDITLLHGDCLEMMKNIPDNSIDMVLCDPPYGTTQCKWDSVIPFEPMWEQLKRITKDNGAICLFGSEPFSSVLRMSNIKMFKYDWVWNKVKPSGHLNAKKRPMLLCEVISVFSSKVIDYHPQGLIKGVFENGRPKNATGNKGVYGNQRNQGSSKFTNYPKNLIEFSRLAKPIGLHPTQKPIKLLEYLIKTYTIEGEMILDFASGSASTGVAAKNLNRSCILIEKDDKYFEIGKNRINETDQK